VVSVVVNYNTKALADRQMSQGRERKETRIHSRSKAKGLEELEDEQMTTQIRKPVVRTERIAAIGLLSLVAMTTWANKANAQSERAPAMMGHIEVTARPVHLAADSLGQIVQKLESLPVIGRMTVTATRLPTLAEQSKQPAGAGEPAVRTRSPRAVLVQ